MAQEQRPVMNYSEFEKDPEAVIDNCNTTGDSVVLTSRGRLLFLISPLDIQESTVDIDPTE